MVRFEFWGEWLRVEDIIFLRIFNFFQYGTVLVGMVKKEEMVVIL